MGNQREIVQTAPVRRRGVVLRVLPESAVKARELVAPADGEFYTYIIPANETYECQHMDGPIGEDEALAAADVARVFIQSGGKMWCGYEQFVEHVRALSPLVEDAIFYVGDEEDYIDEFRICSGGLHYQRVHQGYWRDVEEYLATERPTGGGK